MVLILWLMQTEKEIILIGPAVWLLEEIFSQAICDYYILILSYHPKQVSSCMTVWNTVVPDLMLILLY